MIKWVIFFSAVFSSLISSQYLPEALGKPNQRLYGRGQLEVIISELSKTHYSSFLKDRIAINLKPASKYDLSLEPVFHSNSNYFHNQTGASGSGNPGMNKLEKLGVSQMLFAGVGVLDYSIKEAPMYPGYREDTFFWKTAWGTMVWGSAVTLNLFLVKDAKYLLGILTEDMVYFLCRQVFHKQDFPSQFTLPFKIMGTERIPMNNVAIIWAVSLTYLLLDALEII